MIYKLKKPDMVQEAAQTGGKNLFIEILMFLGVYIVAQIFMAIPIYVVDFVMLIFNQEFLQASMAGDIDRLLDIEMQLLQSNPMLLTQLFATALMILVALLFCKLLQKRKMRTLGYKKPGMWKEYGVGLLVGLVMMTVMVLVGVATGALSIQFNSEMSNAISVLMLVLLFMGFMVQGMSEEALCRGYFLVSLSRKKGNVWLGISISSIAFAALHLGNSGINPLAFVNLMLFGIFAGIYFVKRGNIWGIAAVHTMWNFAQGNIFGVLVSGINFGTTIFTTTIDESMTLINGGDFGLEGGILTTIVLTMGIMILMMTRQKDIAAE